MVSHSLDNTSLGKVSHRITNDFKSRVVLRVSHNAKGDLERADVSVPDTLRTRDAFENPGVFNGLAVLVIRVRHVRRDQEHFHSNYSRLRSPIWQHRQ